MEVSLQKPEHFFVDLRSNFPPKFTEMCYVILGCAGN